MSRPAGRRGAARPVVQLSVGLGIAALAACRPVRLPPPPVAQAAAAEADDAAPPPPAQLRAIYRSAHDEARRTIRADNAAAQLARLAAHIEREGEA